MHPVLYHRAGDAEGLGETGVQGIPPVTAAVFMEAAFWWSWWRRRQGPPAVRGDLLPAVCGTWELPDTPAARQQAARLVSLLLDGLHTTP
ncbi:hypothetical protein [Streptomyces sp. NPDC020965]|uniref:hypothetical protein n=1 Tax=Streptomyces sp. NPDC020965 TaxID=3365105 RepID=UPI0037AFCF06